MVVKADISALWSSKWQEYAIRFFFGGLATVFAGVIAQHYGPELGGLFLAFPAIAPATATLLDQQQKEEKEKAGMKGHTRGRRVAALDMFGTLWGTAGLLAFAMVIWLMGPAHGAWPTLIIATVVWFGCAFGIWGMRRLLKQRRTSKHRVQLTQARLKHDR
jgi:hypothetical protein